MAVKHWPSSTPSLSEGILQLHTKAPTMLKTHATDNDGNFDVGKITKPNFRKVLCNLQPFSWMFQAAPIHQPVSSFYPSIGPQGAAPVPLPCPEPSLAWQFR